MPFVLKDTPSLSVVTAPQIQVVFNYTHSRALELKHSLTSNYSFCFIWYINENEVLRITFPVRLLLLQNLLCALHIKIFVCQSLCYIVAESYFYVIKNDFQMKIETIHMQTPHMYTTDDTHFNFINTK